MLSCDQCLCVWRQNKLQVVPEAAAPARTWPGFTCTPGLPTALPQGPTLGTSAAPERLPFPCRQEAALSLQQQMRHTGKHTQQGQVTDNQALPPPHYNHTAAACRSGDKQLQPQQPDKRQVSGLPAAPSHAA